MKATSCVMVIPKQNVAFRFTLNLPPDTIREWLNQNVGTDFES